MSIASEFESTFRIIYIYAQRFKYSALHFYAQEVFSTATSLIIDIDFFLNFNQRLLSGFPFLLSLLS